MPEMNEIDYPVIKCSKFIQSCKLKHTHAPKISKGVNDCIVIKPWTNLLRK